MKYKSTKRNNPKPLDVIVRCVNCNNVADTEDIKFGCARCEAYKSGGHYTPKNWTILFPEGGWYQELSSEFTTN